MSKTIIEKEKFKKIVQGSYKQLRIKDREGKTRSATISAIARMIKKELKDDAN